ncbi:MAG: aldehyde dehydrogenase (NADP(+)) [Micromonosporaceae bacterium]
MTGTVQGYDPRTGTPIGDPVPASTPSQVDAAGRAAAGAAASWAATPATDRAETLDAIAGALDAATDELVAVADVETALGPTRLTGEIARTTGQLRMFGDVLRRGEHVDAILSPAPDAGAGRPDVRRMMRPIGPVAVFSASNFPFAFSVAGGDTASALAAGCPVVVKAHEAHPRTSALTASVLSAVLPEGVFGLVTGFDAGPALVRHPAIRAVGFTGSLRGGRALYDLAQQRPDPIPFYGELGSVNPVVVLPGGAASRPAEIADGYLGSLTLGTGQFCTNPGLLFVPSDAGELLAALAAGVGGAAGGPMLSERIHAGYAAGTAARELLAAGAGDDAPLTRLAAGTAGNGPWGATPYLWRVDAAEFAALPELAEEVFGPAGLVVTYRSAEQLATALAVLPGSLTGAVHADSGDTEPARGVAAALTPRVGRMIYNGWPTGVAVCWAMHHGGPWPASTVAAYTSVGATAIQRWLAPIAYQDWPQELLPPELTDANPLGVPRLVQPD